MGKEKHRSAEFLGPVPSKGELASSRREFLQLMGAGAALASTSCMRRPAEKLVPYVHRPKDIIPGEANYYASSYCDGGEGFSIVIKSLEGRPVKIEGNEEAGQLNRQALSPRSQAFLLSLYDPERLKGPRQNLFNKDKSNRESVGASYADLDSLLAQEFKKGGTALLSPRIPSPSFQKLVQVFKKTFQARHYVWDPISFENIVRSQEICYGQAQLPSYNIENAEFVFAVNCDFLGTWLAPAEQQRRFALGRNPEGRMSRLVVLESLMSLTGANADERLRIAPKDQMTALTALAQALWEKGAFPAPPHLQNVLKSYGPAISRLKIPSEKWKEWAEGLLRLRGRSLILFGDLRSQGRSALEAHILADFLNSALGNEGRIVDHSQSRVYEFGSYRRIQQLTADLQEGRVKRLIIHGLNPLYSYARAPDFLRALKKAEKVIYTGDRMDETGLYADYIVPDSHSLEKWCDWEFKRGVFCIQQPAIRPLYNTRAFEDSLIQWIRAGGGEAIKEKNFYGMIKASWQKRKGAVSWETFLKTGLSGPKKPAPAPARPFRQKALERLKPFQPMKGKYFLNLYESASMRHGDMANNSWLMEFPDPVSKICWENYISVSPQTALKEALEEGRVAVLLTDGGEISAPVHIQPGQEDSVLGLSVGWGRTKAGSVGSGRGENAWPLAGSIKGPALFSKPVLLRKTPRFVPLANVQGHHQMEGRDIVLESSWREYQKDPSSGLPHSHKNPGLWSKHDYKGHKWGMVIDLNSCNGCGTCITACQAENNIPTVGKKYVLQGREMHWIRVDRYYKGDMSRDVESLHQPVVCMHCDNAPCETVCPVLATVHSTEGTNDMVYNRCVGTRYCSNNCPYKVRRFNWFDYTKQSAKPPLSLVLNPDVTLRHRGVMEKCSFCIQRIQGGKAQAKKQDRKLQDGDIQTACQQSCPAGAISFGDLNDPNSKVSKAFRAKNSYALLDDMLNTKPAVRYRSKIRNKKASVAPGGGVGAGH